MVIFSTEWFTILGWVLFWNVSISVPMFLLLGRYGFLHDTEIPNWLKRKKDKE